MELLKQLTMCIAPSGREDSVRSIIEKELEGVCDEIYTDALGNLICHKKGSGKKLMLTAHIDEIGFMVTFIDDKGFLRFNTVGGQQKLNCINSKVEFEHGVCGTISYENKEDPASVGFDKMYIDIGASSKEEAESKVSIGDMATFAPNMEISFDKVMSKALDDRAGCYVLIKALKETKESENDLYVVFTAQEEVGLRGAKVAANRISPHMAIAFDVSSAGDTPFSKELNLKLGKGPAIKMKDASFIIHPSARKFMVDCANSIGIEYQLEAAASGGTDAGAIHLSGSGAPVGTISIPTRYIHSQNEVVDIKDLHGAITLAKALMKKTLI